MADKLILVDDADDSVSEAADDSREAGDDGYGATDLLRRIDEELDAFSGTFVEIADPGGPIHLVSNGADTTSIMEGPYEDNPGSAFASEFDEILDRHAAVNAAFPTNDLDAHTQLQAEQRAAENAIAPFTCINPASLDRGNLGQTVILKPGISTDTSIFSDGEPQMVAFWPGDDREACPVTVTCAPQLPYSTEIVRAVANIKWGCHGAKFEALVDIGSGFELSINASNVYLSVYLEGGDFTGSAPATMGEQLVAGAIGFQQASHQQAVFRTLRSTGTIAGTFTVQRPAFATSLLSFERGDISGPTTLNFLDQAGTTVFIRQYAALAYIGSPISLPSEIAAVRVTNGGGATTFSLVFGLF